MKLKSYISILMAVLVLCSPYLVVGQNLFLHNTPITCCNSNTDKSETGNNSQEKESKDCCKKNVCVCPISISIVAFVKPIIAGLIPSNTFIAKNEFGFYLDKVLKPATAPIWQPPKF